MKIALVHDYLNQFGGGERVLESLMEIFPEAPIYTLLHDREKTSGRFENRVAKTSFLDFSLARRKHRFFIPLMPLAANFLDLGNEYDLVISDTAGFAKGIRYGKNTKHISYVHTPLRYAWEQREYLGPIMTNFQFSISKPILNYLRKWDYKMAQRPEKLIANSNFIAGKIKNYYGRDAEVLYPPVDLKKFYPEKFNSKLSATDYYLAVGRLLHYKRFDLLVDTFAKLGLPLKIIGSGPESDNLESRIKNLETKNIELLPFVNNENELRALYNGARALIFPQVEDFGLVAAEALACGTPVIAYGAGGALEIIQDGKTGILFRKQKVDCLIDAVSRFEKLKLNKKKIAESAQRFSKERFLTFWKDLVYNPR